MVWKLLTILPPFQHLSSPHLPDRHCAVPALRQNGIEAQHGIRQSASGVAPQLPASQPLYTAAAWPIMLEP